MKIFQTSDSQFKESAKGLLLAFIVASIVTGLRFALQGHIDIDLADEGYLWYGGQRTALGEVPIRDFMAYDPGRYYWVASVMKLLGDSGIIALRVSTYLFDFIGLFVGLSLLLSNIKYRKFIYAPALALILVMWMYPHNKTFDYSSSIFLVGALSYLVANPTRQRCFIAGLCLGFVAVIGRNHGVYGLVASIAALTWLSILRKKSFELKSILYWMLGVIAGFSPTIIMCLFVEGFFKSFIDSITFLFEIKGTNLSKPIPWPWDATYSAAASGEYLRDLLVGVAFVALLVFGFVSLIYIFLLGKKAALLSPIFISSAFLALPYSHYAFSRADVVHLAQGIFPVLIGSLVLVVKSRPIIRGVLTALVLLSSFWVMHYFQPGTRSFFNGGYEPITVAGDQLLIHPSEFSLIAFLRDLHTKLLDQDQSIVVTPLSPGAYPILGQRSPMWEINALFPRNTLFQEEEIRRIKSSNPGVVLIEDVALDGREELRFKNTHPLIFQYITDNFHFLPEHSNSIRQVYKIKAHD